MNCLLSLSLFGSNDRYGPPTQDIDSRCRVSRKMHQKEFTPKKQLHHLPSSSLLGLEVIHIDRGDWSTNEFHGPQGGNITTGIVFDKESQIADALKLDVLEGSWIGRFPQVFGRQMQGLRWIDIFPIFKTNFPIQENVNFGRIQFWIRAIVEFGKFD